MAPLDDILTLPELAQEWKRKFRKTRNAVEILEDRVADLESQTPSSPAITLRNVQPSYAGISSGSERSILLRISKLEEETKLSAPRSARALQGVRDLAPAVRILEQQVARLDGSQKPTNPFYVKPKGSEELIRDFNHRLHHRLDQVTRDTKNGQLVVQERIAEFDKQVRNQAVEVSALKRAFTGSSAGHLERIIREQHEKARKSFETIETIEKKLRGEIRNIDNVDSRLRKLEGMGLEGRIGRQDAQISSLVRSSGGVGVNRAKKIEQTLVAMEDMLGGLINQVNEIEAKLNARLEAIEEVLTLPDAEKWKQTDAMVQEIAKLIPPWSNPASQSVPKEPGTFEGYIDDLVLRTPAAGGPVHPGTYCGGNEGKEQFVPRDQLFNPERFIVLDDPMASEEHQKLHDKLVRQHLERERAMKAEAWRKAMANPVPFNFVVSQPPRASGIGAQLDQIEPTDLW